METQQTRIEGTIKARQKEPTSTPRGLELGVLVMNKIGGEEWFAVRSESAKGLEMLLQTDILERGNVISFLPVPKQPGDRNRGMDGMELVTKGEPRPTQNYHDTGGREAEMRRMSALKSAVEALPQGVNMELAIAFAIRFEKFIKEGK